MQDSRLWLICLAPSGWLFAVILIIYAFRKNKRRMQVFDIYHLNESNDQARGNADGAPPQEHQVHNHVNGGYQNGQVEDDLEENAHPPQERLQERV